MACMPLLEPVLPLVVDTNVFFQNSNGSRSACVCVCTGP